MEQDSLAYKTLRNSSYFLIGYILPIIFTIFVTPFIVHSLGVKQYGIFILVGTINSFLGLVDLGFSTALTKYVAEYHAIKKIDLLNKLLQSAQTLSVLFGIVGLAVFFVIGKWFLVYFHVAEMNIPNVILIFVLSGVVFFLNSLTVPNLAVITGLQRYDVLTKVNMASLILGNVLTAGVLFLGFQLKAVVLVNVVVLMFSLVINHIMAKKILPEVSFSMGWDTEQVKKAYNFGLQTFVSNIASSALIYFDRLIIPIFLGPAQLSYYSLPGNVALRTSGLVNSISAMLFPMASALQSAGEEEKLKIVYIRTFRNLNILAAGISLGVALFAHQILYYWLGKDFAEQGTLILVILSVTYYFVGLYIPLQSMLLGLGRVKFLIKLSVFMAIINLISLLILVPIFGIIGAAWAYLISVIPMVYAFWWIEHSYFNLKDRLSYYLKFYIKILFSGLLSSVAIYFIILPQVKSLYLLIILGPVAVALFFAVYYFLGFAEEEDVVTIKAFFYKFIVSRFKINNK